MFRQFQNSYTCAITILSIIFIPAHSFADGCTKSWYPQPEMTCEDADMVRCQIPSPAQEDECSDGTLPLGLHHVMPWCKENKVLLATGLIAVGVGAGVTAAALSGGGHHHHSESFDGDENQRLAFTFDFENAVMNSDSETMMIFAQQNGNLVRITPFVCRPDGEVVLGQSIHSNNSGMKMPPNQTIKISAPPFGSYTAGVELIIEGTFNNLVIPLLFLPVEVFASRDASTSIITIQIDPVLPTTPRSQFTTDFGYASHRVP